MRTQGYVRRRQVVAGVSWALPAIAVAAAVPAQAVSACRPDLAVQHLPASPQSAPLLVAPGDSVTIAVRITEVLGCDACGASLRLRALRGWTLAFDATFDGDVLAADGNTYSVTNSIWSVINSTGSGATLSMPGACISASSSTMIAFSLTNVSAIPGSLANVTTGILVDTAVPPTYDTNVTNNSSV